MRDYADAIIRDAIDRVEPVKEADVSAIRDAALEMLLAYQPLPKEHINEVQIAWIAEGGSGPIGFARAIEAEVIKSLGLALRGGTP